MLNIFALLCRFLIFIFVFPLKIRLNIFSWYTDVRSMLTALQHNFNIDAKLQNDRIVNVLDEGKQMVHQTLEFIILIYDWQKMLFNYIKQNAELRH